tara:strand:+ start:1661 stop:1879 length:219 start_codon:yes stop_codon:yes gene_type:complete
MSKTKLEKAHDKFFYDLLDVVEDASKGGLDVPHAVFVGIQFFTQMALDCAPNTKEARLLIKDAMKDLKKEAS